MPSPLVKIASDEQTKGETDPAKIKPSSGVIAH
jgi:hypothetical protein